MRSISAQKEERPDEHQLDPMEGQELKQAESNKQESTTPVSILRKPSVLNWGFE